MIRRAKESDIPYLCKISEQPGLMSTEGNGDYAEWYAEFINNERGIALVYQSDDIIIGGIIGECLIANGSILWMLGILPDYQGGIYAVRLLNAYEKECINRGIDWIYTDGYTETVKQTTMKKLGYLTSGSTYKGYVKSLI